MSVITRFKIIASLILATVMTAGVYSWDLSRSLEHQNNEALQWARQIAVQAEGLAIDGRSQGKPDPAGWAIGFLSQAVEPRTMKISKYQRAPGGPIETFRAENRILDYGKVAQPENGEGFRVRINLGYRGFLGSNSEFGNDLSVFILFSIFFICLYLFAPSVLPKPKERTAVGPEYGEWLTESKVAITQLGGALRDLVKDAHGLATHTVQTREELIYLREHLYDVRATVKSLRLAVCSQAEQMEQASAGEGAGLKLNGFRLFEEQLSDIEVMLDPLCSDGKGGEGTRIFPDLARKFNADVTVLKTSVIAHLGLMQKLKEQLENQNDSGQSEKKTA